MNYKQFYKMAADSNETPTTDSSTPKVDKKSGAPKADTTENVQDWGSQIPMLALLAGTGALGGYALARKNKKGSGAAYGALSLPALYAAYVAARRNNYLTGDENYKWLDDPANAVNDYVNGWFTGSEDTAENT